MNILSHKDHCSICLSDIENKDKKKILICQHIYHASCIKEWRETNITCPVCRSDMPLSCSEKCDVIMSLPRLKCMCKCLLVSFFPLFFFVVIVIIISIIDELRKKN